VKKSVGEGDSQVETKEMNPWPSYIQERLDLYDRLKAESDALFKGKIEQIEIVQNLTLLYVV